MICMATPKRDPRAATVESLLFRHGLSNRWLAEQLKVNNKSVGDWLKGESRPRNGSVFDRMIEEINAFTATARPGDIKLRRTGARLIPVYGGINAGVPGSTHTDVTMKEVLDWGNDRERWGRIVVGRSMVNTDHTEGDPFDQLLPGDDVTFEERSWENGDVVHAYDGGEDIIKVAWGKNTDRPVLVPLNHEEPVIDATRWNIKGVAVKVERELGGGRQISQDFKHGMHIRPTHPDLHKK